MRTGILPPNPWSVLVCVWCVCVCVCVCVCQCVYICITYSMYVCSMMRGRIKGIDSTILATAVLYELRWNCAGKIQFKTVMTK